ncbi:hypothetical protein M758_10G076900 [Ceratodon purpureus]|nr:hypothetical protein M758_10G076900 [Ceratodon purpureus]
MRSRRGVRVCQGRLCSRKSLRTGLTNPAQKKVGRHPDHAQPEKPTRTAKLHQSQTRCVHSTSQVREEKTETQSSATTTFNESRQQDEAAGLTCQRTPGEAVRERAPMTALMISRYTSQAPTPDL